MENGIEEEYASAFVDNKIKGRALPEVISDEDTLAGMCSMFGGNTP
jgi:hypothetical protein